MKKLTSFTSHIREEGQWISYTYSEVDEVTGKLTSQNNRENFIVLDAALQGHIDAINSYIENRME